jgi:glycosyltransferase involved in cell wall biosynthesis
MKIGVVDPDKWNFSQQLIDHWEEMGHEVVKSMYHEPKFVKSCDVVYYEYASQMVVELAKGGKKPDKCIVRGIDVENYMNYYKNFNWDLIDHFILLNEKQLEIYTNRPDFTCPKEKIEIIPPGIDMSKYTLRPNPKKKKAVFVGRLWIGKNVAAAVDVVYELNKRDPGWELYIRGDRPDPRWWKKYLEHRVETCGFPVHFDERVDDMNAYLEDKDVTLIPSYKEAFSYVTAEAMAKGIPALINDWYGAKQVWPATYIYRTPSEAAEMYYDSLQLIEPKEHRKVVADKYDEKFMFNKIDKLMGLK